jgi:hypothetical protein
MCGEVLKRGNYKLILRSAVALRPAKSRKFDSATRDIIRDIMYTYLPSYSMPFPLVVSFIRFFPVCPVGNVS